ncbi:uncharacterized protein LOC119114194 [Pollicipes pollicipes]|uniref:uncharacterized protein LOC119114194 n=1 Tax=Pollicipes pollicipes TaxID=41117 RepID=UPI00188492B2|nr:uncharacterized protein LOC119114194 [Pollicipes pollicipes]
MPLLVTDMDAGRDAPTISSLQDHKGSLEMYKEELKETRLQISTSADQSAEALESAMKTIMQQLVMAVQERKAQLLAEILDVKKMALAEADHYGLAVDEQLKKTEEVLNSLQSANGIDGQPEALDPVEDISLPPPSGLPRPALHVPVAAPPAALAALRQLGRVESTVTVNGLRTEPRPGAVLVTWAQDEDVDRDTDGSTYRLQYCYGDANKLASPVFHLAYEEWSPSPEYTLSDAGRIACRSGAGTGEVYVDGRRRQMRLPPLRAGSQITFTTERRDNDTTRVFLETDDKQS